MTPGLTQVSAPASAGLAALLPHRLFLTPCRPLAALDEATELIFVPTPPGLPVFSGAGYSASWLFRTG